MRAISSTTLLSLLSVLGTASADTHPHSSSGFGRYFNSPSLDVELRFSADALSAGFHAIGDTVFNFPNRTKASALPLKQVYGVNLGGWLLIEPWMIEDEWASMGGENCGDCSSCRRSEWSLSKSLGQTKTNAVFKQHWQTFFTKADVDQMVAYGINTVRIPTGFWLVPGLTNADEPYAQEAMDELIRGLKLLKAAGISVIIDQHALPGVSSKGQMFAGNCTQDIHFYQDDNYVRAATWGGVMAFMSHVHPDFESVFALQAVNEPEMNYALTPGLDRYEKGFVLTIRAIELALGIICDARVLYEPLQDPIARKAIAAAIPIIVELAAKYNLKIPFGRNDSPFLGRPMGYLGGILNGRTRKCVSTNFMNRDWQWSADPSTPVPNPADAARGPQVYDNHLYFCFGGVADSNPDAYLKTMCNIMRTEDAAAIGNSPMFFGEWSLCTNFPSPPAGNGTSDEFYRKWGDAQKLMYGKSAGWIFWSWKITSPGDWRAWSYKDAVSSGLMPPRADQLFDSHVCDAYKN